MLVCGQSVGDGWYHGFKVRHPSFTNRTAQSLYLKQTMLRALICLLCLLAIELKHDSSRVLNVDDTAFQTKRKSKKVVAVRGSTNVRCTDCSVNFHISIVLCGNRAGFVVPPVFVLPGKTVELNILEACKIPGAAIRRRRLGSSIRTYSSDDCISSLQLFPAA